tara:strand:- start:284 stop:484 length:201 start_codon:yes stop_codon:yes gene_type:complete
MVTKKEVDYRNLAVELVEEMGVPAKDMLISCLKYMSHADVEDMLHVNEYIEDFRDRPTSMQLGDFR